MKIKILIALCLGTILMVFGWFEKQEAISEKLELANKFFSEGNFEQAIPVYQEVQQAKRNDEQSFINMIESMMMTNQFDLAEQALAEGIVSVDSKNKLRLKLLENYITQNDYLRFQKGFQEIIRSEKDSKQYINIFVQTYIENGEINTLITFLEKVVKEYESKELVSLLEGISPERIVYIKSSVLEEEIRNELSKHISNLPAELRVKDMLKLTDLDVSTYTNKPITSLDGLQYATNLKTIILNGNNDFKYVSPLFKLTNLTKLHLKSVYIDDVSQLTKLKNLTDISVSVYKNETISSLSEMTNLSKITIICKGEGDVNLEIFSNLKHLTDLRLFCDTVSNQKLKELSNLKKLQVLELSLDDVEDLTPLASLTKLNKLRLRGNNQLSDLTPLSNMTELKFLSIYGGESTFRDLTPLANLTKMEYLDLGFSQITDLTPLADLTNMKKLDLSGNKIRDITPLANFNHLNVLSLKENDIKDISTLANSTSLTRLSLSENQIEDISVLANMQNMKFLDLVNNRIRDITPLSNMLDITELYLNNNLISDVTPLKNLHNVERLYLDNNQISDVSPLASLTNITDLNPISAITLRRNPVKNKESLSHLTGQIIYDDIYSGPPRK